MLPVWDSLIAVIDSDLIIEFSLLKTSKLSVSGLYFAKPLFVPSQSMPSESKNNVWIKPDGTYEMYDTCDYTTELKNYLKETYPNIDFDFKINPSWDQDNIEIVLVVFCIGGHNLFSMQFAKPGCEATSQRPDHHGR